MSLEDEKVKQILKIREKRRGANAIKTKISNIRASPVACFLHKLPEPVPSSTVCNAFLSFHATNDTCTGSTDRHETNLALQGRAGNLVWMGG